MLRTAGHGSHRTITIDRPANRNALRPRDLTALEGAVASATEPVLSLEGAGGAFCAGADLATVGDLDQEAAVAFARHGQRVARSLESYDGVVVAGIDGPALGGGLELALACDIRVATPRATLGEPGVALGLFGAWGGTVRLPQIVGLGAALDLGCSGRTVDAETARSLGLVSRVTPEPASVAADIAAGDAAALRTIKRRTRDRRERIVQERAEARAFGELIAALEESPDRND